MVYFSKKQKLKMRQRKQKVKLAIKSKTTNRTKTEQKKEASVNTISGDEEPQKHEKNGIKKEQKATTTTTTGDDDTNTAATTRKRPREEEDATEKPTKPTTIIIPANLSGKQAKKFRKDERRKARANGTDDSLLKFVVEGHEEDENDDNDDEEEESKPQKKKKKSNWEFPRINELLKQEEELKQKEEAEKQRKQDEEELPLLIKKRYVAVDCEMVGIGKDGEKSALARVSLVDWFGTVLLDTYVQVPGRVTDFRTHVSGILPKHISKDLNPNAMSEVAVRQTVSELLEGKILVGHALKNDLHALLLQHPKHNIRDTAKYRPFQRLGESARGRPKWKPRKLRDLVKENCGLAIQEKGKAHDSVQDATASMELFKVVRKEWEQTLLNQKQKK